MQLGRRIKELRKKRNITQQDLAEMLGELKKELENSMFDFVRKDICLIIN